jgi:hypothetical protein
LKDVYNRFARPKPTQPLHYRLNSIARSTLRLAEQGLLGLWLGPKFLEKMKPLKDVCNRFARPKPIQPHFFLQLMIYRDCQANKEKGEFVVVFFGVYFLLLSAKAAAATTMMMATTAMMM